MQYLYQNWIAAGEIWTKSTVFLNLKSAEGTVRKGVHAWMTRFQVTQKYGEVDGESIILSLEEGKDPLSVRGHPDDKTGKVGASCFLVRSGLKP